MKTDIPKIKIHDTVLDYVYIIFGILSITFALEGLLVPNQFFDGGITGLSILLHEKYHFDIGIIIISLNIPLILIGYKLIGKKFFI